jgi:hypothetical protein
MGVGLAAFYMFDCQMRAVVSQRLNCRCHFSANSLIYLMPKIRSPLKSRPMDFRAIAYDLQHFRDSHSLTLGR